MQLDRLLCRETGSIQPWRLNQDSYGALVCDIHMKYHRLILQWTIPAGVQKAIYGVTVYIVREGLQQGPFGLVFNFEQATLHGKGREVGATAISTMGSTTMDLSFLRFSFHQLHPSLSVLEATTPLLHPIRQRQQQRTCVLQFFPQPSRFCQRHCKPVSSLFPLVL